MPLPFLQNGQQTSGAIQYAPLNPDGSQASIGTPIQTKSGVPVSYSPVPGANANGAPTNAGDKFGYITTNGIGDPAWGTGITFETNGKIASLNALKNSMSTANPQDYQGLDELRSYYRNALADLPGNTQNNISSFDTQSQRGLSNLLTQYRNANAGTGRIGSRQYSGAQGDITANAMSQYNQGLLNARNNALDQAGKISAGLGNVQNQNLAERQFQSDQGQNLAEMIRKYVSQEQGLPDVGAQNAAQSRQNTTGLIQTGATLAALAAMSDAREKKAARPATREEILKPFRRVKPHSYLYKDEKHGKGPQVSPMAQDLIGTEFEDAVIKQPGGELMIDYGRLCGRMFSAISELTKRVDELKGEIKAKQEAKNG